MFANRNAIFEVLNPNPKVIIFHVHQTHHYYTLSLLHILIKVTSVTHFNIILIYYHIDNGFIIVLLLEGDWLSELEIKKNWLFKEYYMDCTLQNIK